MRDTGVNEAVRPPSLVVPEATYNLNSNEMKNILFFNPYFLFLVVKDVIGG